MRVDRLNQINRDRVRRYTLARLNTLAYVGEDLAGPWPG